MIKGLDSSLSVIDKRIASELHKKQIEGTLLAERVAFNFDRIVDETVDDVLGKVAPAVRGPLSEKKRNQAIELLGQIGPRANEGYLHDAKRIAHWSFNKSVSIFAKNIPRKWFRQIAPEVVMVGERIAIGPNVEPGTIEEPVWQKELTEDEWEALLKEVLFDSPTEEQVLQIINQQVAGKDVTQRLNDLSGLIGDPQKVVDDLAKGLSSGENLQQISKRLEKQVQGVKSSARRIARTESLRVLDQMNRQAIDPLQDLLLGMQVLATLDQNTRPHHVHRHGRIYFYDRRRNPPIEELPILPDEPNCRCWSSPVMKPPEGYEDDPALRAEFANNDGDSIPDPGVYTQWFDKSDLSARKLAVGSRRYREIERSLNGDREPEWTDFVDEDGKLLSIQQIRNEDDLGRAKRKQLVQRSIDKRADLISQVAGRGFVDLNKPAPKKTKARKRSGSAELPAYRLAKTTREAEEVARSLDLADKIDHGKLSVEVANVINKQVHDLITRYPSIRSELKFIGSTQSRNRYGLDEAMKVWEKRNQAYLATLSDKQARQLRVRSRNILRKNLQATTQSSALAVARRKNGNIDNDRMIGVSLNESHWKKSQLERTLESLPAMVSTNTNPIGGDSTKYVIDHELGHVIDFHLDIVKNRGYGFKDQELSDWLQGKSRNDVVDNICEYAGESTSELVAESWGEYQNNPKPREYSTMVAGRMTELLKEKNK